MKFAGWRILAFAAIAASLSGPGQTIGVSVFVDHFIADLDLSRAQVSTAYLIGTTLGGLTMPAAGRWIDRVGGRTSVTLIGLAFGAALIGMSGVAGFVTLAAGFTFIRLLGQGALMLANTVVVTHWFDRRRGLAIGLMMTAVSGLMSLSPVLLNLVIEAYSWRIAWLAAATTIWLVVVPIGRWGLIDRPSDVGQYPDGLPPRPDDPASAGAPGVAMTRRDAMRTYRFWLLVAVTAATAMLVTALNFQQISLLGEAGLSAAAASLMFLPQVVGAVGAGLAIGTLSDRVGPARLLWVPMALLGASLGLAAIVAPGVTVLVYAVTLGAAAGSMQAVGATVLPRWFGVAHIGEIQGVATLVGVTATGIGPVALTLGRSLFGSYGSAALAFAVIPLLLGVAALGVERNKMLTIRR